MIIALWALFRVGTIITGWLYPLGHGYFKGLDRYAANPKVFVWTRIWPVLNKHFSASDPGQLERLGHKLAELLP